MTKKNRYYEAIYRAIKSGDRATFRDLFLKLHEQDQVEVFHQLYPENKAKITGVIDAFEFAELFERLDIEDQLAAMRYLPKDYLQAVFSYVADDNVVRFLHQLDDPVLYEETMTLMRPVDRVVIERMLGHDAETAGAIMTTEMITVKDDDTVGQVITKMRQIGQHAETIYYIYVVDEGRHLVGVLSLKDLLFATAETKIKKLLNSQTVEVNVATDQEQVARIIKAYDLLALPVVDDERRLLGIVTVDDIMDVVDLEATEDFHRFAGISVGDDAAEETESVLTMTKARLPWILILIFLGLISANLIGMFEETLSKVVALAAFMPIIMDSAGNVGTQSLAVSVRRITMGVESEESFWQLLFKEFLSGLLMGLASCVTIGFVAYVLYHNIVLSGIIGVSLWVTLSVSTVVGYIVPAIFNRLGIDPAVASGPFITTINDSFGLLIYFSMATYLLHHLS